MPENIADYLIQLLFLAPAVLISLSVHECAHAFAADRLGDPTPRYAGRLSLNPMRHLDPLGAVSMLLFRIGWAKPVPINCRYFKKPKAGMALTAIAGPLSNLLLATVAGFFYVLLTVLSAKAGAFGGVLIYFALFFYLFHSLNISLAIFNLIPIPPFDGSRLLFAFLPDKYYFGVMRYERYIQFAFIALLMLGVADGFLAAVTEPISSGILSLFFMIFLA